MFKDSSFKNLVSSVVLSGALLVSACAPNGQFGVNKEDVGLVVGALGGAFAAENVGKGKGKTLSIAAGTLLGGYIGKEIGASLDRADALHHAQVAQHSLERSQVGQTTRWANPDTRSSGSVTPTKTFFRGVEACREFQQEITVAGKKERGFGTACRQADGSWKIQ